jgi:hypothetical protein
MDQRTSGLETPAERRDGHAESSPRDAAEALSDEVAAVRDDLDTLLGELDRRRHELLDVRLQVRRHARGVTLTAVAFVVAAAGVVWLRGRRERERQAVTAQAGRLRQAVSRMIDRPERVAAEPTFAGKIGAAVTSAAAASLVKKALERGVEYFLAEAKPRTAAGGRAEPAYRKSA